MLSQVGWKQTLPKSVLKEGNLVFKELPVGVGIPSLNEPTSSTVNEELEELKQSLADIQSVYNPTMIFHQPYPMPPIDDNEETKLE